MLATVVVVLLLLPASAFVVVPVPPPSRLSGTKFASLSSSSLSLSLSPWHRGSSSSSWRSRRVSWPLRDSEQSDWDVFQQKLKEKIQQQQQQQPLAFPKAPKPVVAPLAQTTTSSNDKDDETTTTTTTTTNTVPVLPTPNVKYSALDVVTLCMNHLQDNHVPVPNAGLQVCFAFSSHNCRAAVDRGQQQRQSTNHNNKNNNNNSKGINNDPALAAFVAYASNPTFASMMYCHEWKVQSVGPVIAGTPTRGAMQTVLIQVSPAQSISPQRMATATPLPPREPRQFLWTLQQERRPPQQGCWLIQQVMYTKNAFALTM